MSEENKAAKIVPDTPDFSAGAAKFDPEKLAVAVSTVKDAAAALAPVWEQMAMAIRRIANTIFRWRELEQAIKWAAVYNPRLARFYRHTKKKRIRKKYAKRILAWYREEVLG